MSAMLNLTLIRERLRINRERERLSAIDEEKRLTQAAHRVECLLIMGGIAIGLLVFLGLTKLFL